MAQSSVRRRSGIYGSSEVNSPIETRLSPLKATSRRSLVPYLERVDNFIVFTSNITILVTLPGYKEWVTLRILRMGNYLKKRMEPSTIRLRRTIAFQQGNRRQLSSGRHCKRKPRAIVSDISVGGKSWLHYWAYAGLMQWIHHTNRSCDKP